MPSFDEMVITRFRNPRTYLRVLRDPRVRKASASRTDGLDLHWIYSAEETPGF